MLTTRRTKPAVPFGGKYRIIDFALSNCVNSGLFDVMLLTQYRPHSLVSHIGVGRPWDLDRSFTGGVRLHHPFRSRRGSGWYSGTADSVQQNFPFVRQGNPDYILILSGDHIYKMNYTEMIDFHRAMRADVTIATLQVPREEASRFGILGTNESYRATSFVEKPPNPPGNLASMGIYIFSLNVLDQALMDDAQRPDSSHDFGHDLIPHLIESGQRVFAFPYDRYWVDVGTVDSYWLAHMDLLRAPPALDLNDRDWIIRTRSEEHPPAMIRPGTVLRNSLLTNGCMIGDDAIIERSVLAPGVRIGAGTVVRESIVLNNTRIGSGTRIERAIIDKEVIIGDNVSLGEIPNPGDHNRIDLVTIGKRAFIPTGMTIGPGCVIDFAVNAEHFSHQAIGKRKQITRSGIIDLDGSEPSQPQEHLP